MKSGSLGLASLLLALASAVALAAPAERADTGDAADGAQESQRPAASLPRASDSPAGEVERVLRGLEHDEQAARKRFDELGKLAEGAEARTLLRGRAYVRLARAGLLAVGGGFSGFVEHATKLERLRHGLAKDAAEHKRLIAERARLALKLDELGARIRPLRVEYDALSQAEHALLSIDDRERAFERAFDASHAPDHTAVYGAAGPSDPAALSGGFASLRGRLPFPITGRSEIKSTRRGSDGPGLEMRAPLGTPVRAVFPGRVAFADSYAEYGKTVIIDHGNRHYTVSANLAAIDVEVGDELEANHRVGSVGDSGRGALVYFEIRVGTTTVDPAEWFGL